MRITLRHSIFLYFFSALLLIGCGKKGSTSDTPEAPQEDLAAKKMLQGIWVNSDDEAPAFKVKGDSIFYPDTTSLPVAFQIFGDTIVTKGSADARYAITKQTPNNFWFKNQYGDEVKLVRSENPDDAYAFEQTRPTVPINQRMLIKRDTVVFHGNQRYHVYVQVNPTTYKVIKTTYNDEGVEVGNIYYDNIINLAVFNGARKVYSSDFHKHHFKQCVPSRMLSQCILHDMTFDRIDDKGLHLRAMLAIPDTPTSYIANITVGYDGRLSIAQ